MNAKTITNLFPYALLAILIYLIYREHEQKQKLAGSLSKTLSCYSGLKTEATYLKAENVSLKGRNPEEELVLNQLNGLLTKVQSKNVSANIILEIKDSINTYKNGMPTKTIMSLTKTGENLVKLILKDKTDINAERASLFNCIEYMKEKRMISNDDKSLADFVRCLRNVEAHNSGALNGMDENKVRAGVFGAIAFNQILLKNFIV